MLCLTVLTLGATPARAGYYTASFSGGQCTGGDGNTYDDYDDGSGDYSIPNIPGYGYGGYTGVYSAQGTVTVTCTWVPDDPDNPQSDPPPQNVILDEQSDAYFEYDGDDTGDGSCSDGLINPTDPEVDGFYNIFYGESQGEHYSLHTGGPSFTYTRSPSIDPGPDCDNNAYFYYTVTVDPDPIVLVGPVKDSSNNLDILIGQQCKATMAGIPSNCLNNTANPPVYAWTFSGPTFLTWSHTTPAIGTAPANPNASYYNAGNGTSSLASPLWYWNELDKGAATSFPEVVTCSVTVTPPAGQGAPFKMSDTQTVNVYVPAWTCTGIGGYMQILMAGGDENYYLEAEPTPAMITAQQNGGIWWAASVTTPTIPVAFGAGKVEMVQTITPNDSYTTTIAPLNRSDSYNGMTGLDQSYPYGAEVTEPTYNDGDTPGLEVLSTTTAASYMSSFVDTLMYEPPNSSQYVPLATFSWSANGSAMRPSGGWSKFVSPAGQTLPQYAGSVSVGASNPSNSNSLPFTPSKDFPKWTQIIPAPSY